MISSKKLESNRKNIGIANRLGLNIHLGDKNYHWKGGIRQKGNYPCPQCRRKRICEKRNANRICVDCFRSRKSNFDIKEWYKKTQQVSKEFAVNYKGGKCEMCGIEDLPLCCYHFHHIKKENKLYNLGRMFHQKINEKTLKELDKCILLCANCHHIIHWQQKDILTMENT